MRDPASQPSERRTGCSLSRWWRRGTSKLSAQVHRGGQEAPSQGSSPRGRRRVRRGRRCRAGQAARAVAVVAGSETDLARLHRGGVREAMTVYGLPSRVLIRSRESARLRDAADDHQPVRSIGWCWFCSEHIRPYALELGRPGIWLRIDLEKPPSTQMSCAVT